MKVSKIILGVAAWLLISALYSVYVVASSRGPLDSPEKLLNLAGVVVALTVAIGLFRHRRWAMWLYFAYAAVGLALFVLRGDFNTAAGDAGLLFGAALAAILIPAILIWFRRDRLGPAPAERPDA